MTGITRQQAAEAVAALFGTSARRTRESRTYDPWEAPDQEGKKWRFVYDASIVPTRPGGLNRANSSTRHLYHVEMNSPVLEYSEIGKLQAVVRALRRAGAVVNSSCGMHVHVDAANHTPQSLKNALTIMYAKEDILFKALKVHEDRVQRWYEGTDESRMHYSWTRYYALNLHSVFYRGTLEWRCFESTLHAGKVRANITLALAISAQAINQKKTVMRKTGISENPAFTFRTFLLRLGLIGPEYKNVRAHLMENLPGDKAWRYDKTMYASNQHRENER